MDYQALYQSKCVSAREIADQVKDNYRIVMNLALEEPKAIVDAICTKVKEEDIHGVQIEGGVEVYPYGYFTDPDLIGKIKYVSWFSNPFARNLVNKGIADIWPSNYRDGPRMTEGFLAFDAVVITVSPMDEHGYFSFGVTGSQAEAFMKASKHTFLEVNPNMPRALHGPIVHISQVDLVCENEFPLVELPQSPPTENTRKIAGFIAEEIGDGACLQLGIGAIVTSSKNEVDYVVTEYGIARLRGKTIGQRAKALISIAHPKFRDEMTWQAKKMNLMV